MTAKGGRAIDADDVDAAPADALAVHLFRALARQDVAYCYWKASLHLRRAIEDPLKDLDLLVAGDDVPRAVAVLRELGFRRMAPPRGGGVPGTEHWVGFDAARGMLVHVHLHRELHTGRPPLYEWRLPFEAHLLRHRERSGDAMVLEPALEVALLAIRAALEPKHRTGGALATATRRDLTSLAARAPRDAVERHLAVLLGAPAAGLDVPASLEDPRTFARWRTLVRGRLSSSRRPFAGAEWSVRLAMSVARGAIRRTTAAPAPRRGLRAPASGLVVAVLGPDGAGKTTLTEELARCFGQVVDVERLYLGRGDWVSEAQQLLAEAKWRVLETVAGRARPAMEGPVDDHGTGERARSRAAKDRALQLVRDASRVALARRKARDLAHAARLRSEGILVLTDRFPHPELQEMDGPAIRTEAGDPAWRGWLARLERRAFDAARATPDLVVRLRIQPAVAHARKPDHRLEDIERKAAALEQATFGAARVVELDAELPLADVRALARRAVWEAVSAERVKIEFVGLPGAGKTTLADRLVRELRARGVECVTRADAQRAVSAMHSERARWSRWRAYLGHVASEPEVALAALGLAARGRPRLAAGYWRAYCLTRHAHNEALLHERVSRDATWVLDQDILQEVWGVLYLRACPDERVLRRLLDALRHRLPDVIVHCEIDGATALERMAERRRRVGPLGDVDRMTWMTPDVLRRSGRETKRIARAAAEVAGARLIEVDASQPIDAQLAHVLSAVTGHQTHTSRAAIESATG